MASDSLTRSQFQVSLFVKRGGVGYIRRREVDAWCVLGIVVMVVVVVMTMLMMKMNMNDDDNHDYDDDDDYYGDFRDSKLLFVSQTSVH